MRESKRQDDRGDEVRPRYLTNGGKPANDGGGLVLITKDVLMDAIREAVGEAQSGVPLGGRLLNRDMLAERLAVSGSMVDKMRRQGMPCVRVGDSPRYVFEDCVSWLQRAKEPA